MAPMLARFTFARSQLYHLSLSLNPSILLLSLFLSLSCREQRERRRIKIENHQELYKFKTIALSSVYLAEITYLFHNLRLL